MNRRQLLSTLGASVFAPAIARAQSAKPLIGYLSGRSLETDAHLLAAVRDGLKEAGYVDGENVTMVFRWADGNMDRVPALAAELVKLNPTLIAAVGGTPVPLVVQKATTSIPTVFTIGTDPVALGLVKSYNRPGGNMTGSVLLASTLEGKRIDLLHEMVPDAKSVALMVNPASSFAPDLVRDARTTATARGLKLDVLNARNEAEIDRAFDAAAEAKSGGLAVSIDSLFIGQRERILARAMAMRLPAIYPAHEFPDAGGLASYSARWADMYRWAGVYAGRILKGAKPGDLPVQQPTTYELVLNAKTARTLGLALPPAFVARADEVIE
jgi:putative ABC transport system substrate-binding protein